MKVRRNLNIIEKKNKKVIKWSSGEGGQVISKNSQIY